VLGAAGGVGLTAVEIGKAMGARVIAAAGGMEKLAVARSRGADFQLAHRYRRPGFRAEGCWTLIARDRMPRSSPPSAHPPTTIAENAPTATRVIPRERVRTWVGLSR
jgi:hypothetical protein